MIMFYHEIPDEEIPEDIKRLYYYKVKDYIGQLVLDGHMVVRLAGIIRDDKTDGEWCVRFLTFPSQYYFNIYKEVQDSSILCADVIPLKGIITNYEKLEESWKMNEERCPYTKDWMKVY